MQRESAEGRCCFALFLFFPAFDVFPLPLNGRDVGMLCISENMRVTAYEFVCDDMTDILQGKEILFLKNPGL
jgi:hypothetical protein